MITFSEIGLKPELVDAVSDLGFETPTPIQAEAIPFLIDSDQDLIGSAQTGTGKTAAFGLPALHKTEIENKNTQTLILCPTRELCIQITKDLKAYAKYCKDLNIVAIYGGASMEGQIREMRRGAQVIVGTPGRTRDMIERRKLFVNDIKHLILDEADEMLTMGFKDELDAILSETPEDKQTLLFSATMSRDIRRITKRYMTDPKEIAVAKVNLAAKNVKHIYYLVSGRDKYEVAKRIADMNPDIYGIIFCRTRRDTNEVAARLIQDGYNADALNGDLSQAQRDEVMGKFRKRTIQILVATDIAARGLDVKELTHVMNFDLPDDPEVYVHRSGRTGRAGSYGLSIAICTTRELRRIRDIERTSEIAFEKTPVPGGKEICERQLFALIDRIQNIKVNEEQIEPYLETIYEKLADFDRETLIRHFVSAEFNRFLDYYKNARDINLNYDEKSKKRERERKSFDEKRNIPYQPIRLGLGKFNSMNPKRLLAIINQTLDSSSAEIGRIDIQKSWTIFEIDTKYAQQLVKASKGSEFEMTLTDEKPAGRGGRSGGGKGGFKRSGGRNGGKPKRFGDSKKSFSKKGSRGKSRRF